MLHPHFSNFGARRYLVISIAMVAAIIKTDAAGLVAEARVAVGSCSATAQRLTALEKALVGEPAPIGLGRMFRGSISPCSPPSMTSAPRPYTVTTLRKL